jgi:hypothetical protein
MFCDSIVLMVVLVACLLLLLLALAVWHPAVCRRGHLSV